MGEFIGQILWIALYANSTMRYVLASVFIFVFRVCLALSMSVGLVGSGLLAHSGRLIPCNLYLLKTRRIIDNCS